MNPEAISAMSALIDGLMSLGIPYYIGDSVASSAYGVVRSTLDADIIADLQLKHVAPLADILHDKYYLNENTMREAIQRRSCFNVIHLPTMFKVDVFLPKDRSYNRAAFQKIQAKVFDEETGRQFYVASPEDTILSKLEWYRLGDEISEEQWSDILGIIKVQQEALDRAYLDKWAAELGVADLLIKAWRESESNLRSSNKTT
jgi:hypothetical protein